MRPLQRNTKRWQKERLEADRQAREQSLRYHLAAALAQGEAAVAVREQRGAAPPAVAV